MNVCITRCLLSYPLALNSEFEWVFHGLFFFKEQENHSEKWIWNMHLLDSLQIYVWKERRFSQDNLYSKCFLQLNKCFETVSHNEELCLQDWFAQQVSTRWFCALDPNLEDKMWLLKHMRIRLFELIVTRQIYIYSAKLILLQVLLL